MTIGVGEVADLVDDEQMRTGVMAQTAAQSGIAVECAEIAKQGASAALSTEVVTLSPAASRSRVAALIPKLTTVNDAEGRIRYLPREAQSRYCAHAS
jgi:hypothetical protein